MKLKLNLKPKLIQREFIIAKLLVISGVAVLVFRREQLPEPHAEDGPPAVDVRSLTKVYGRPGPIGRAWRAPDIMSNETGVPDSGSFARVDSTCGFST